jgi:hypothetical protein
LQWKDSGKANEPGESKKEDFFDEEQYSPWALSKDSPRTGRINRNTILLGLACFAVLTSVTALLMLLFGNSGDNPDKWQLALLQERVAQLEERLSRYDDIDEKVTHIWDQARAFEKFQDRFERTQASMSLRMEDITGAVEMLQKTSRDPVRPPALPAAAATPVQPVPVDGFHTVVAGDTLYNISKRYLISLDQLLALNGLEKNSVLKIGQKLIVKQSRPPGP